MSVSVFWVCLISSSVRGVSVLLSSSLYCSGLNFSVAVGSLYVSWICLVSCSVISVSLSLSLAVCLLSLVISITLWMLLYLSSCVVFRFDVLFFCFSILNLYVSFFSKFLHLFGFLAFYCFISLYLCFSIRLFFLQVFWLSGL